MKMSNAKGVNGWLYVVFDRIESALLGLVSEGKKDPRVLGRLGTNDPEVAHDRLRLIEKLYKMAKRDPESEVRGLLQDMFLRKTKMIETLISTMQDLPAVPNPRQPGHTMAPSFEEQVQYALDKRGAVSLLDQVAAWNGITPGSQARAHQRAVMRRHVERFIADSGARTTLDFTVDRIKRFLNEQLVAVCLSHATREHYRNSLSSFAVYLINHAPPLLGANVVQLVALTITDDDLERAARTHVHAFPESEQRLIVAAAECREARVVYALMFGACVEFSVIRHSGTVRGEDGEFLKGPVLFKKDFARDPQDPTRFNREFKAKGSKASAKKKLSGNGGARNRIGFVKHDWCWEIIEPYLQSLRLDDPFVTKSYSYFIKRFDKALVAAGLERHRKKGHAMHVARHSFITQMEESGEMAQPGGMAAARRAAGHERNSRVIFEKYIAGAEYEMEGVLVDVEPSKPRLVG